MTTTYPFHDNQHGPEVREKLNAMWADFLAALESIKGDKGWSPLFLTAADVDRVVIRLYDWTGGQGDKPTQTGYLGPTGLVENIAQAMDLRGPTGLQGSIEQVGPGPDQVPAGLFLGALAYMDRLGVLTPMEHQPTDKRAVWAEFVNDTALKLCMRGDDGVVRSTTWTLI